MQLRIKAITVVRPFTAESSQETLNSLPGRGVELISTSNRSGEYAHEFAYTPMGYFPWEIDLQVCINRELSRAHIRLKITIIISQDGLSARASNARLLSNITAICNDGNIDWHTSIISVKLSLVILV